MTQQIGLFDIGNTHITEYIDYNKASHLLGVSVATLRNWVKANHIKPAINGTRKPLFKNEDILILKGKLAEGTFDRLKNRANKRNSKSTFIPVEYLHNKDNYEKIERIIALVNSYKIPIQTAMLLLSLTLLKKSNLILNDLAITKDITSLRFKNKNIEKVIFEWLAEYPISDLSDYKEILTIYLPEEKDLLGIVYQSLIEEGNKAQGGSYYTPAKVIDLIIKEHNTTFTSNSTVLDPCCGTGQFLLSFAEIIKEPSSLWGYDIDKIAVHIARVNLLLAYPTKDFYPNIFCKNTLEADIDVEFDVVATNPPWGYHFSNDELFKLNRLYPTISSKEAFSYFLLKGLKLLKANGKLFFVLPEAILKVRQHNDIRSHILNKTKILNISHLGNVFSKVLSPVILLTLEKSDTKDNQVQIKNKSGAYLVNQSRFLINNFYVIDTEIAEDDSKIIAKVYQKQHLTLEGNANWALGIVTGNNKALLSSTKDGANEGILKGSDIKKYYFNEPLSFITFNPQKLQQTAPEWKYRAKEKLIYKFISDTLTFAYDKKQTLTLNSANILIPKFDNYSIKLVLAFLNSTLFQYLYKKKFNTIKVLRGDLEKLPFPIVKDGMASKIIQLTDRLIVRDMDYVEIEDKLKELDSLIFSIFDIDEGESRYIKESIKH